MAKDTREYSVRMLENARKNSHERPDPNPVFMPVGRIKPETFNQALERIMSHSAAMGMTLQEAYDSVRGEFDFDDDPEVDDYVGENYDDDEFEQSQFSSYETPNATQRDEVPASVGTQPVAKEPEPTPQPEPTPEDNTRDSE